MNAFFNILTLFVDLFRVRNSLFSVIPRVVVEEPPNVVEKCVVVALDCLIWFELMPTPIFISVVYLTATLPDNVKQSASTLIFSTVTTLAFVSIV